MFAPPIQTLFSRLRSELPAQEPDPLEQPVSVNELTSKAGSFYEKIRYLFDYKEEHTIRRSAVERQLKRHLSIGRREDIGPVLVQELISGGYLPNRTISEETGRHIQQIIDDYLLLDRYPGSRIRRRLISLAATEIDRYLKKNTTAELTAEALFETVSPHIKHRGFIDPHTLTEQVYIACRRGLLEEDDDMLFYALWLRHVPDWHAADKDELARSIPDLFQEIRSELNHSLSWRLLPRLQNYKIYFLLIKHVLDQYGSESQQLFENDAVLQPTVEKILQEEYENQYTVARKSGIRAIIYIFLTKILVAFALEVPAELYLYSEINYIALGSNILIHPFILFLMTRRLPTLQKEHIATATEGVKNVISGENLEPIHVRKRGGNILFDVILTILYLCLFIFTFGLIISLLIAFGFNIVSILLFLMFLALVSYFGFRIRHNAKKWRVKTQDRAVSLLWRILTLPIIRAGRWLSRTFSTVNVFVFFMDFIIETPFKLVLSLLEAFVSFLREKEEEIY